MSRPSPITPRPATDDDITAVLRIERASHSQPWTDAQFLDELKTPQSAFLVLTDDETDEIVSGFIIYRELLGETHILNVAVDPKERRRGWGKRLVQLAINDAYRRGDERVFLEVRVGNAAARALYAAMGFKEAGRRKGFYSNGEEAIFMELRLKSAEDDPEPASNVYH
jgi:ribosomal-protein-alanine N-acetyltransferase